MMSMMRMCAGLPSDQRRGPARGYLRPDAGAAPALAREREADFLPSIQKGTRVLTSLWDSLTFGRVPERNSGAAPALARGNYMLIGPLHKYACVCARA